MSSTLQKLDDLEVKVTSLTGSAELAASKFGGIENYLQMLAQRTMAAEEAVTSLGKVMSALVSELNDAKLVNQKAILTRIRLADEAGEKERIKYMEQVNAIKESSEATSNSILIVSQTVTSKDGLTETVSDYRTIELSAPQNGDEIAKEFVGKKVGDVVEYKGEAEGGTLYTKIDKIYEFVQVSKEGEPAQA